MVGRVAYRARGDVGSLRMRRRGRLLGILAALVLAAGTARAEEAPPAVTGPRPALEPGFGARPLLEALGERATGAASAPLRWGWEEWGGVALGLAASFVVAETLDEPLRDRTADDRAAPTVRRWAERLGGAGEGDAYRQAAVFGLALAEGMRDRRLATAVADAWLASEFSGVVAGGLQAAIGRRRPRADEGADEFRVGCRCAGSWPSVHATRAFAVATVLVAKAEGAWAVPVAAVGYGFATAVAASRVAKDGHWASDVIAGAGLGIAIGLAVSSVSLRLGPLDLRGVAAEGPGPGAGLAVGVRF